ncbi:MAG: hypothetical protein A2Y57_04765 [Candidatus Woykebacteria bacterium RBG_13_40_7b]|uniref:Uncharacterized protein n=1 Tax=Candidatus Woykebacteria bacterium RBG_13_40_7b TaxID=1802594 RepID=A0A1G1WB56_9BACT|nr:MAG: hypothetical protein A2Y57_04765 [Candidatus Woykebacteria bacterium RBG_13_40_7b]
MLLKRLGHLVFTLFVTAFFASAVVMGIFLLIIDNYERSGQPVPDSAWTHFYVAFGIMSSGPAMLLVIGILVFFGSLWKQVLWPDSD